MQELTPLINECQQLHREGKNDEEILNFLRSKGCSKVESIVVVKRALEIEPVKAKKLVHFSKAWADRREADEQFHESLHKAFEEEDDI